MLAEVLPEALKPLILFLRSFSFSALVNEDEACTLVVPRIPPPKLVVPIGLKLPKNLPILLLAEVLDGC